MVPMQAEISVEAPHEAGTRLEKTANSPLPCLCGEQNPSPAGDFTGQDVCPGIGARALSEYRYVKTGQQHDANADATERSEVSLECSAICSSRWLRWIRPAVNSTPTPILDQWRRTHPARHYRNPMSVWPSGLQSWLKDALDPGIPSAAADRRHILQATRQAASGDPRSG